MISLPTSYYLFSIFQVFWNPGITLSRLFKHFIKIMQRIALIELLEVRAAVAVCIFSVGLPLTCSTCTQL